MGVVIWMVGSSLTGFVAMQNCEKRRFQLCHSSGLKKSWSSGAEVWPWLMLGWSEIVRLGEEFGFHSGTMCCVQTTTIRDSA